VTLYQNAGGSTLWLPSDPRTGQFYIIKNVSGSNSYLTSSSANIIAGSALPQSSLQLWNGTSYYEMTFAWYDGVQWMTMRTNFD
jgi:hypothetical protein